MSIRTKKRKTTAYAIGDYHIPLTYRVNLTQIQNTCEPISEFNSPIAVNVVVRWRLG